MLEVQEAYLVAKAAYEAAIETKQFDDIEELEDNLLDTEFALYDWFGELAVKTKKMSKEDIELLRRKSTGKQWDKIIEMAANCKL
jgi:hypothetical protein